MSYCLVEWFWRGDLFPNPEQKYTSTETVSQPGTQVHLFEDCLAQLWILYPGSVTDKEWETGTEISHLGKIVFKYVQITRSSCNTAAALIMTFPLFWLFFIIKTRWAKIGSFPPNRHSQWSCNLVHLLLYRDWNYLQATGLNASMLWAEDVYVQKNVPYFMETCAITRSGLGWKEIWWHKETNRQINK